MAQIKAQKTEPLLLNKTDLCRSLGISTTAFDKWAVPVHSKKGRECLYAMSDVVANRVGNERSKQQSASEDFDPEKPNLDYERYRLTKAQADGQELKNEQSRKEVVDVGFNIFVLNRISAQVAPVLDQIHIRMKRKFPDVSDKFLEALKGEVIKSQNTVSELAEMIEDLLDEYIGSAD
ncbi:terminase small subunit [Shewanella sp. MBTL60-007]|uniref:terminase small subunit n=1 Tax=Shewanella sp. MBTL60-007 TaxID=2815911 RepID=UPI001BB86AE5|nr:terminase small subunit [Shewanella sp. MBTL60-007]GIU22208.1 DNA-packaging protein NU1 [Shewanella sp. MBTL60-007]